MTFLHDVKGESYALCYRHEFELHMGGLFIRPAVLQGWIRQLVGRSQYPNDYLSNALNHHGSEFPDYKLGANIWYNDDTRSMSNETGWTLSWQSNNMTEWYMEDPMPIIAGEIPYFGVQFHRRVSLCQVIFDAELSDGAEGKLAPGQSHSKCFYIGT